MSKKAGPIHTFNTGAAYTARGQRIAFAAIDGGHIAFMDADRGIDGLQAPLPFTLSQVNIISQETLNRIIHDRYLRNDYKSFLPSRLADLGWDYNDINALLKDMALACRKMPPLMDKAR